VSVKGAVQAFTQRERYKDIVRVNADEFNLEQLYAFFDHEKLRSDMKNVFRRLTCFQFAWEAFLYCCCLEIVVKMELRGALAPHQSIFMPSLVKFIEDAKGKIDESEAVSDESPYFIFSFTAVTRYMEECIRNARSDSAYFQSDIALQFKLPKFLKFTLTDDVLKNFQSLLDTCTRGFLISLDGFDTAFDMFRQDTITRYRQEEVTVRANFEVDWLRAFLLLVLNIKERRKGTSKFYELMEFCITVPKDRFLELLRTERDAYRYTHRYCSLNWSGIELALLLLKRFQELTQQSSNKALAIEDRLVEVMRNGLSNIPIEMNFHFNGKPYSMPVFMYVLRHTFWRPRDILLYYAKIISAAESMRRRGIKISPEAIRRTVQDTTYEVIKSEFVNEFASTVINIKDIIEAFHGSAQVLSYSTVAEILSKIEFKYAYGSTSSIELSEKINFLYQVGFFGLVPNAEMLQRLKMSSNEAFYFNAALLPLRAAMQEKFKSFQFILHPIFCEYLQLNTSGQELTLQFRWDQLHEMEDLLFASGTAFVAF